MQTQGHSIDFPIPLIGVAAFSGTGKTTLLLQVLPLLKDAGLRVAVVKHAHHTFDLDRPGKDSYRLRSAGADEMLIASRCRMAWVRECNDNRDEPDLRELLAVLEPSRLDLVLVEGFKHESYPKIELHRTALRKPLLFPDDPHIIAIATDGGPLDRDPGDLPLLSINDPAQIAAFVMDFAGRGKTADGGRSALNQYKAMTDSKISATPSCADDRDGISLTVSAAREAIRAAVIPIQHSEQVTIRAALGRVLAQDCVSPIDVPGHTNSAMDGYALAGNDLPTEGAREYEVIATLMAGQTLARRCAPGQCVRIMTGAPMPPGTDTVVMQEQAERLGDQRVRLDARHRPGQNVRRAGEDIGRGTRVFGPGRLLSPADIGVLASLGFAELRVRRRPRVAFFSTGDELRSIGETLGEGEIYDSNRYSLFALLTQSGVEIIDLGVVRDDRKALREAFEQAATTADVVITSGGVSVGEADYTKEILAGLGEMAFWSIAMKPGRPLSFGRLGDALFFGLPGNPVAVMLTFQQFVRPALRCLAGADWPVPLVVEARSRVALKKRPGRFEFVRGVLDCDDQGRLSVRPSGAQGSGILTSMSRANCFILLDEACAGVAEGDVVRVEPFSTLL